MFEDNKAQGFLRFGSHSPAPASSMEGVLLDTENIVAGTGATTTMATMAGERISVKRPSLGSAMRKKLSDITNGQQRSGLGSPLPDENSKPIPSTTKYYIEQLHKENTTLLRLVEEKNKIIELRGLELQKIQMNMKKTHQQNFQLAQANSQMLAELNFGKDRLKALQHELGCTVALLKAKNLELEEKLKISHQEKPATCEELPEPSQHATDDTKPCNPPNGRRQSRRISSSRKSAVTQKHSAKDDNNKRICLRRQSSASRSGEPELTEDLFEIEDTKLSVHPQIDDSMADGCPTSLDSASTCVRNAEFKSVKEERDRKSTPQCQEQELRRSSIGRPLRKAAEKVSSYKEKPVNVKMRRAE